MADQESVIARLMKKVTAQAMELSDLYNRSQEAAEYTRKLEIAVNKAQQIQKEGMHAVGKSSPTSVTAVSTSENALKRKIERQLNDRITALEKQVSQVSNRLQESVKARNTLQQSLDVKTKEYNKLERKLKEITKLYESQGITPADALMTPPSDNRAGNMDIKLMETLEQELKDSYERISELENEMDELKRRGKKSKVDAGDRSRDNENTEEIESLQRQIVLLQQKLLVAQDLSMQHNSKEGSSNTVDAKKYQDIVTERDILLEYIHDDMEKSGKILEKLHNQEEENRVIQQENMDLKRKLNVSENALETEISRCKRLQQELSQSHDKLQQNKQNMEKYEEFYDTYHVELEKKILEVEEYGKLQVSLLMQIREKEESYQSQVEEVRKLRHRLRECDDTLINSESDLNKFKQRLQARDDEVAKLSNKLQEIERSKIQLDNDTQHLRSEKNENQKKLESLEKHVSQLKPLERAMNELNDELQSYLQPKDKQKKNTRVLFSSPAPSLGTLARASPGVFNDSPNNMQDISTIEDSSDIKILGHDSMSLVYNLSPMLYDYLKNIFHDFQSKDSTCREAASLIESLTNEVTSLRQDISQIKLNHNQTSDSNAKALDECRKQLNDQDQEISQLRHHRSIIQQIRYSIQMQMSEKKYTKSFLKSDIFGDINVEHYKDVDIPEMISRLMIQYSNQAFNLQKLKEDFESMQSQYKVLKKSCQELEYSKQNDRNEIDQLKQEIRSREQSVMYKDNTLHNDLERFKSLADNQKTTIASLEGKVEDLQRDLQLKSSQLQSVKQREESSRRRLFQVIETYSDSIGMTKDDVHEIIPSDTSIVDLLDYLNDLLRSFTMKISNQALQLSLSVSPSSVPTRERSPYFRQDRANESGDTSSSLMYSPDVHMQQFTSPISTVQPMRQNQQSFNKYPNREDVNRTINRTVPFEKSLHTNEASDKNNIHNSEADRLYSSKSNFDTRSSSSNFESRTQTNGAFSKNEKSSSPPESSHRILQQLLRSQRDHHSNTSNFPLPKDKDIQQKLFKAQMALKSIKT